MRSLRGRIARLALWIVFWASLFGALAPPVDFSQLGNLLDRLKPFFAPQEYWVFAQEKAFLLLFAVALLYSLFVTYIFRHTPISMIRVTAVITLLDNTGTIYKVETRQHLRPNHPGIAAYYSEIAPGPGGSVERKEVWCRLENAPNVLERVHLLGSTRTGWEWLHEFDTCLPYRWYFPLVPVWIAAKMSSIATIRTAEVTFREDPGQEEIYFQLAATRYPTRNIEMILNMEKMVVIKVDDIKATIQRENAMENVPVGQIIGKPHHFRVQVKSLDRNEKLRVTWPSA